MLTAINIVRPPSQLLGLSQALGIRATCPFPTEQWPQEGVITPGDSGPILLPHGSHIIASARWGIWDAALKRYVHYANATGQNFGSRGLLFASSFVVAADSNGAWKNICVTSPEGIMKIAVTFAPHNCNGPIAFKVLFCSAGPDMQPHTPYQPLLIRDRYCLDFLSTQKSLLPLQSGEYGPPLTLQAEKFGVPPKVNPFESLERDPNYSNRTPVPNPRSLFLLK